MLLNDFRVFRRYVWTGIRPEREDMETVIILNKRKLRFEHGPPVEDEESKTNTESSI